MSDKKITEDKTIDYFNLLCELDETKIDHNASKSNGCSTNEVSDLYKKTKKLEDQVVRDGKKLDGEKLPRSRGLSPTTIMIQAYLAEQPDGSVTINNNRVPSLFDWAYEHTDEVFGNAEITKVNRHNSITFLNTRTGTENTVLFSSLKSLLSKAKKS